MKGVCESRATWDLNPWPLWVPRTKSHTVNWCPHIGSNITSCDQVNDGKMPKSPRRPNGIVVEGCNYKCAWLWVLLCRSVIMKSHSEELRGCRVISDFPWYKVKHSFSAAVLHTQPPQHTVACVWMYCKSMLNHFFDFFPMPFIYFLTVAMKSMLCSMCRRLLMHML